MTFQEWWTDNDFNPLIFREMKAAWEAAQAEQIEIDAKVCDGLQGFSASACAAAIRGRAR